MNLREYRQKAFTRRGPRDPGGRFSRIPGGWLPAAILFCLVAFALGYSLL